MDTSNVKIDPKDYRYCGMTCQYNSNDHCTLFDKKLRRDWMITNNRRCLECYQATIENMPFR